MTFIEKIKRILRSIKLSCSYLTKEGRKARKREIFWEFMGPFTERLITGCDWRAIVGRLWNLANSDQLPKTLRRPEDVKQWLFTTVSILELLAKEQDDESITLPGPDNPSI